MADSDTINGIWIGGTLAIAAGAISGAIAVGGTLLADWRTRRNSRRQFLRERLEELAGCVARLNHWVARVHACTSLDELRENRPPDELQRVLVLALLYFPELKDAANAFHDGMIDIYHRSVDAAPATPHGLTIGGYLALIAKRSGHDPTATLGAFGPLRAQLFVLIEKHCSKYA
jgi:hypothetical protein